MITGTAKPWEEMILTVLDQTEHMKYKLNWHLPNKEEVAFYLFG